MLSLQWRLRKCSSKCSQKTHAQVIVIAIAIVIVIVISANGTAGSVTAARLRHPLYGAVMTMAPTPRPRESPEAGQPLAVQHHRAVAAPRGRGRSSYT